MPPRPISAGEPPEAQVRGSRRRTGGGTGADEEADAPRENAVNAGVVWRSATSVTLNAAPQKIIVTSNSSGTGMRASRPLNDA